MTIQMTSLKVTVQSGRKQMTILDIPYWEVKSGDRVAIFGPSGCGKSTLLYALAGLLPVSSGTLTVCGHELQRLSEVERDRFRAIHIGFIYQNFNLLHGFTVLENVLLGMTFSPDKTDQQTARRLLTEVGLSHRIQQYPVRMSAGEQQRVAVARALAKRPCLLLADEPTASLDHKNAEAIMKLLIKMCEEYECTLVLVSHSNDLIRRFPHKVSLETLNQTEGSA